MRTFFIVNPASRCGTTRSIWQRAEKLLSSWGWEYQWAFTEGPNHATSMSTSALEQGYQLVVAVGGDGTLHEVINGFFRQGKPIKEEASLGLLPSGTGTDFAKALGIPRSMREAARRLLRGKSHRLDLGMMSCQDLKGNRMQRLFANIAEGGLGAATVQRVNARPKKGGTFTFLAGTIRTLVGYRNRRLQVTVDDQTERRINAIIVIVANGRFFGGGMKIAPQAEPDDGLFDIVLVKDLSRLQILRNLYRIYTGSHIELPEVEVLRGKKVILEPDEDLLLEADGELLGKAPAEFTILPRAVRVKC